MVKTEQVAHLVKAKDNNVAALLNSGKPIEIRDGILLVAFASDILQDKFNRPESLDLTRKAIHEALGVDSPVQAVITGGKNALPPTSNPTAWSPPPTSSAGRLWIYSKVDE